MTVSIVIPNYNGEKLINKNLANVIQVIKGPARIALARNASRNDASGTQSVAGGSSDQRIKEIIIVDDASKDGSIETISKQQTANRIRITRLAYGLPSGASIEYADEITLGRAIDGRREY